MKTWCVALLFSLFTFGNSSGQVTSALSVKNDLYTRFQNFSTTDGLSSNSVLGIVQDKDGMMWFATMDGLNRFDGYTFKVYRNNPRNINSLSNNFVTCLELDTYGNLWIGTQNGLTCFNQKTNTFTRYFHQQKNNSISNNYIKSLLADKNGFLWIETRGSACDKLDIRKNKFYHIPHKNGEFEGDYYYHQIFKDSKNNIWIGGRCFPPFKIVRGKTDEVIDRIGVNGVRFQDVNSYIETSDKKIIGCSYEKIIAVYDERKSVFEKIEGIKLSGNPCRAVIDKKDQIWIGGYNGLQRIDLKKKTVLNFFSQPLNSFSIPSNTIYFVYKDKDDNIWLGTNHGIGLYSEKWNLFRHYRQTFGNNQSLSSNDVQSLMQDKDGLLWIATEENGVDTVSLSDENFGNIKYNILNQKIDEKTFQRERENLKDYFLRGLIKCADKNRTSESIFKNYQSYKSAPLTFSSANENQMTTVYQDKRGKIYGGIYSNTGFNCYDKKTKQIKRYAIQGFNVPNVQMMYIQDPAGGNWFTQFLEDDKNRFWAVTWESLGLNLFDRDKGRFDGKHFFTTRNLRSGAAKLQYDSVNNRLWMHQSTFISFYDFTTHQFHRIGPKLPTTIPNLDAHQRYYPYLKCDLVNLPTDFAVSCFTLDNRGDVWLAGAKSLVKMDINNSTVESFSIPINQNPNENDVVKSMIFSDKNQTLYFVSQHNFYQYDINLHQMKMLHLNGVDAKLCLAKIGTDIWIGAKNGIWIFNTQKLTYAKLNDGFFLTGKPITEVSDICVNTYGNIWLACKEGLIKMVKGKETKRFSFDKNQIPGSQINDIFLDSEENIWIGTNNGLSVLDIGSEKIRSFYAHSEDRFSLIHNYVVAISEDKEHQIWISTQKGFCKYDRKTQKFIDFSMPDDDCISSRLGSCLMQDAKGNLWYGTTDAGLNKIDAKTEKITHFFYHQWNTEGISSNNITCIYQDKKGQIWIGTDRGLNLLNEKRNQFLHITTEQNLPDNNIKAIKEDARGNLWISTTKGLCVYNTVYKTVRTFWRLHGLADDEFSGAACILQNGKLAFGGYNGFVVFHPDSLTEKWSAASTILYDFIVNEKLLFSRINHAQRIKLSYSENSFSVNFTTSDYAYAKLLKYRYKLNGFDKNWIYSDGGLRTAKYTNIKWGKYKFVVESSNPFGEYNGKTIEIYIDIKTPWFVSWWFILLILSGFIYFIYFIIKYREKRLQEENLRLETTVKKRTWELQETNQKLSVSEENLQKELDTKDKFFSIISHDLRNPSRSMSQMADLLYKNYEKLDKTQATDFLRMLSETAKNNNQLIEKLLFWAITQQQDFPAKPEIFDICDVINDVKEQVKPDAELKKISIKSTVCKSIQVYADKNMIETVLRNLLSNAIKFSFENGKVMIQVEEMGSQVEVRVIDFGVGMESNEVEKLFKKESKLKKQGTQGESGTGLGLILCAEFVKKNGGSIFAQSIKNQKTIITFTIPSK